MILCRRKIFRHVYKQTIATAGKRSTLRYEDSSDIHIDDLDATLEAHRYTNRGKIIRRVVANPDPGVKSLALGNTITAPPSICSPTTGHLAASTSQSPTTSSRGKTLAKVEAADVSRGFNGSFPRLKNAPKPWEFWPAGTVQYSNLYRGRDEALKGSVQEYHPQAFAPDGKWSLQPEKNVDRVLRPWLQQLDEPEGNALQR